VLSLHTLLTTEVARGVLIVTAFICVLTDRNYFLFVVRMFSCRT